LNLLNNSYKVGASLYALHVLRQRRRRRQEPPGSAGIRISTAALISGGDDKDHPVEPLLLRWFTCVLGVMLGRSHSGTARTEQRRCAIGITFNNSTKAGRAFAHAPQGMAMIRMMHAFGDVEAVKSSIRDRFAAHLVFLQQSSRCRTYKWYAHD